jgi:hypothetical protein
MGKPKRKTPRARRPKQTVSLYQVEMVLAQVADTFRELADQAGEVAEWNEGGHAYQAADAVRNLRDKLSGIVRIRFLTARENGVWDTITVEVPKSAAETRETLMQWAQDNLAPQAQYRTVELFAPYGVEE